MEQENTEGLAKFFKGKLDNIMSQTSWCQTCGYPMHEGRCPECALRARIEAEAKISQALFNTRRLGGLRAYEDYTEEKYDSKYYDGAKAISLLSAFPNENLYIWGERGVGKTHLGVIAIRRHPQGLLLKPYDILRELRSLVLSPDAEKRAIERITSHPCLMIDDLGTEKLTEHALSLIYEIVDRREMDKRGGLLITSNYSLDELASKMGDDRVASRLSGMCKVIKLTGKDRRPER